MKLSILTTVVLSAALAACSSVQRAEIPPTANPSDEITRLESDVKEGYAAQLDVLAHKDFKEAREHLEEAKSDLADNESQKEILKDISYGRGYLERAKQDAATRAKEIPAILQARQKAITAGARNFPPTEDELGDVDDDVRKHAGEFAKLDAEDSSSLQTRYLDLELSAIINTQLGKARAAVTGASRAERHAPKALKRAKLDLEHAENLIRANRNASASYAPAVQRANESARILTLVLAATRDGEVDEETAMRLVRQQDQIAGLETELDVAAVQTGLLGATVAQQGAMLDKNAQALNLQSSLEKARKEFSPEEADVFQQGDKLLIRLKTMNFASGRAALPEDSLEILAKVKTVAEELSPETVTVEGHTDSTGSASLNQTLSQKRASAVAKYLETNGLDEASIRAVGYGFKKPIASNKSNAGRAQNRRVDVVITPGAPSQEKSEDSSSQ